MEDETPTKRKFDKRKWRQQKYSNKYKVQQWEERKKLTTLHKYRKELRKTDPGAYVPRFKKKSKEGSDLADKQRGSKLKPYQKAKLIQEKIVQQKKERREEAARRKAEKEEAMKQYVINRRKKQKKISRKTKHGQPVMKFRIEMMLEKIQRDCAS